MIQDVLSAAQPISTTLEALIPGRAETYLAWALWHTAQSEYPLASMAYLQALTVAPDRERGHYALIAARFHLATTYDMCTVGLFAAQEATRRLPDNAEAWTTLAASNYQCGHFTPAVNAARRALALEPQRADATFYRGAALARLGKAAEARITLTHAADLAPASVWRERAEILLVQLD
jgi:tetratricopeptide (TPR) repeat protein